MNYHPVYIEIYKKNKRIQSILYLEKLKFSNSLCIFSSQFYVAYSIFVYSGGFKHIRNERTTFCSGNMDWVNT